MQQTSEQSDRHAKPEANGRKKRQVSEQAIAISAHQAEAARAGKLRKAFEQSSAQYVMRFQDFRKPSRRNNILREFNLEPMHFPFDPVPAKRRKQRKSTRSRKVSSPRYTWRQQGRVSLDGSIPPS